MSEKLKLDIKTQEALELECLFGYHDWKYIEVRTVYVGIFSVRGFTFIKRCSNCKKEDHETHTREYLISNYEKLKSELRDFVNYTIERQKGFCEIS